MSVLTTVQLASCILTAACGVSMLLPGRVSRIEANVVGCVLVLAGIGGAVVATIIL